MPKVSIIMLSYNYGRYISEAIESVLNQSYPDYELIIIDDGSSDGSDALIRDYASKDGRIRFFINPKNMGIAPSFNSGLDKCTGEYIGYISSDDIWERNRLEAGVSILDSKPRIHYVHSNLNIIDENSRFTGQTAHDLYHSPTGKYSGNLFDTLIKGNFILFSSLLMRRDAIAGITINPDLGYLNDWLFLIELSEKGKFYYIPDTLVKYRVHPRSTNLDSSGYLNDYIKLVEIMKYKYKDYFNKNEGVLAIHYGVIGYMLFSSGDLKEGRKYLWKIVHVFPSNVKPLGAIALSFFGTKVYNRIVGIYRRSALNSLP